MSKVFTYSRVSTDKQENSLELQQKMLFEFCQKNGFENAIHLADNAVSGGKYLFDRPEGSKLKSLENGDSLIVLRHDRLFRNFINAINITHELVERGVSIYFIQDSYEPVSFTNYHKEFKLYLDYAMAHMEKRKIGSNTKNGLANRRANGQTNSRERYGFTNISKGKDGKEIINDKEVEILRLMNNLRESGLSYAKIANHLNIKKIYTKKGTKWNHGNIPDMIANFKEMVEKGLVKE